MTPTTLTTDRLYLVPATLPVLDAIVAEDWPALTTALGGVDIAEGWSHFPEALAWMRDYLREHPGEFGWWSYLIVHRQDVRLIGTCGYKGPPAPGGTIEIGYEIAGAYQGRGLATEAARSLVDRAFEESAVRTVQAHTLAEENASVAVLRKLGFSFFEEKFDLEDGNIWRWGLERSKRTIFTP